MSEAKPTEVNINGFGCLGLFILILFAPAACAIGDGYRTKLVAEASAIAAGCKLDIPK